MMEKKAEDGKRGNWNKFTEKFNFDDSHLKDTIEKLVKTDDSVRSIVLGKSIGHEQPLYDVSVKKILVNASEALSDRKYSVSISELTRFHSAMESISAILDQFSKDVDDAIGHASKEVMKRDLNPEHARIIKEKAKRLKERRSTKKAQLFNHYLTKNAGIMDRIFGKNTWEKLFPSHFKKFKTEIYQLLQASTSLYRKLISKLDDMDKFRSKRMLPKYAEHCKKFVAEYSEYDQLFDMFYDSNSTLIDEMEEKVSETAPVSESKPVPQSGRVNPSPAPIKDLRQEVKVEPSTKPAVSPVKYDLPSDFISSKQNLLIQPENQEGIVPLSSTEVVDAPKYFSGNLPKIPDYKTEKQKRVGKETMQTLEDIKKDVASAKQSTSHYKFISSLETLSSESPIILRSFILKYAKSIKEKDPKSFDSLVKIAKAIEV